MAPIPSVIKYYRMLSPKALLKMIWFPPFPLLSLVKALNSSSLDYWISFLTVLETLLIQIQFMLPQQTERSLTHDNLIMSLSYLNAPMAFTVLNMIWDVLPDHTLLTSYLTQWLSSHKREIGQDPSSPRCQVMLLQSPWQSLYTSQVDCVPTASLVPGTQKCSANI